MALNVVKGIKNSILKLDNPEEGLFKVNHILEPEFHQEIYAGICDELEKTKNSFQIGSCKKIIKYPQRGTQPKYDDDESEPSSLSFWGMLKDDGKEVKDNKINNICALKSISIRSGYVDFDTARSVTREFYKKNKSKAGVEKNDVLINSTGDGTIGRVAMYNELFPAIVDGHITILRFNDEILAWYVGAYLLSSEGQKQIYRYINGSSGQVEIYPQDINRIWIRPTTLNKMSEIANSFKEACDQYKLFRINMKNALFNVI